MWALALAVWIMFGAVAVLVMRRRGHDVFGWAIVFVVLGPLALPIAVSADRHRPPQINRPVHADELDVLVAHDGSAAASAALDAVVGLLGTHITSLTLAEVVDLEAATTTRGHATERDAQERLNTVASRLGALPCGAAETAVLHGDPAHALAEFGAAHGYELIVVGASCPGGVRVRRGSVARRLAAGTPIPVFVGPFTA